MSSSQNRKSKLEELVLLRNKKKGNRQQRDDDEFLSDYETNDVQSGQGRKEGSSIGKQGAVSRFDGNFFGPSKIYKIIDHDKIRNAREEAMAEKKKLNAKKGIQQSTAPKPSKPERARASKVVVKEISRAEKLSRNRDFSDLLGDDNDSQQTKPTPNSKHNYSKPLIKPQPRPMSRPQPVVKSKPVSAQSRKPASTVNKGNLRPGQAMPKSQPKLSTLGRSMPGNSVVPRPKPSAIASTSRPSNSATTNKSIPQNRTQNPNGKKQPLATSSAKPNMGTVKNNSQQVKAISNGKALIRPVSQARPGSHGDSKRSESRVALERAQRIAPSARVKRLRDEDEYSEDSFLDDDENEYAADGGAVKSVLSLFRRSYRENHQNDTADDFDDDRAMEAGWEDVRREELRSARIAKMEDERELAAEEERERRRLAKKKMRA